MYLGWCRYVTFIHTKTCIIWNTLAISLMVTAMPQWNCNITKAAQVALECTQFSQETIRRWSSSYFTGLQDMLVRSSENVTDEAIEEELLSEHGHSLSSLSSLIHEEEFQLAARQFVWKHSCVKGEPNRTISKFTEWLTSKEMAIDLGFSRVHHQKGAYFYGHDRSDVVTYSKGFWIKWRSLTEVHYLWRQCHGAERRE